MNTSSADIVVYALLLFQIVTGIWIALYMRWGTAWYTQTAVPYLWSLVRFQPDIQRVAPVPVAAAATRDLEQGAERMRASERMKAPEQIS